MKPIRESARLDWEGKGMKPSKWKVPAWMKPYIELLQEDEEDLEQAMNCRNSKDGCDIVVNAPRAMLCLSRSAKVSTLEILFKEGKIK